MGLKIYSKRLNQTLDLPDEKARRRVTMAQVQGIGDWEYAPLDTPVTIEQPLKYKPKKKSKDAENTELI